MISERLRTKKMAKSGIRTISEDLGHRLLIYELDTQTSPTSSVDATVRVFAKLRLPLSTLIGPAGFRSLLERALTLAKRKSEVLEPVKVNEDGSLEGLTGDMVETGSVFVASLLDLLIAFIGEAFTLRLLSNIWPEVYGRETNAIGHDQ